MRLLELRDPRLSFDAVEKPSWGDRYPSIYALSAIGERSVEPLLAAIAAEDHSARFVENGARVLIRVFPDTSQARQAIVAFVKKTTATDDRRRRLVDLASQIPDLLDPTAPLWSVPEELTIQDSD